MLFQQRLQLLHFVFCWFWSLIFHLIFSFSGLSPAAPKWQQQGKNTTGLAISGHHPTELRRDGCWIKAGFYDLAANPDGGTLKQRWSIAFVNMSQEKFDKVYSGVAGIIWNEMLQQHFADEHEMEQTISQLMSF